MLDRILELAGIAKGPTIVSASTAKDGGINRKTANKMVDPKGWFKKADSYYLNKKVSETFREVLERVQRERKSR